MHDLTLVGVHDDGEHLVLSGADGQRFRVVVDEPLRAAVRRDRARLGQLQIELTGRLRPRDIQTRIRAGQSAEEVAAAAGLPVEHVRRYEGPVLAEREFVARQARSVRIRRPNAPPGGAPSLGDLVGQRLVAREVAEHSVEWDAWRGEEGAWTVCLSFTAGGKQRQARWTYDTQLRHVAPQDDEARWLTDEEPADGGPFTHRRLAPVRDRVYDVEADGSVHPAQEERAAPPRPATIDLLDSLRERRGRRQRLVLPPDDDVGILVVETGSPEHSDGAAGAPAPTQDGAAAALAQRMDGVNDPPAAHPPRSRPEEALDAEVLVLPDVEHTPAIPVPVGAPATYITAPTPPPAAPPPAPARPAPAPERGNRRGKRASVPSWDDIVFGARRE